MHQVTDAEADALLARFRSLQQHRRKDGQRSPHKPLLVLLALGRLAATGSSELPWSAAESALGELIAEFGPPSRTSRAQSAAYPFTRLRNDQIWILDRDVRMDAAKSLASEHVTGRFDPSVESVLTAGAPRARAVMPQERRRDPAWRAAVLEAWDRQCAFCGFDGQLAGASVGIEAAHVLWFSFGGPDTPNNGLALCSLHHKLFDLGILGLSRGLKVMVSEMFSTRTQAGRSVYDLHDRRLSPRPGTVVPAPEHVTWHTTQVFKGKPLAAGRQG